MHLIGAVPKERRERERGAVQNEHINVRKAVLRESRTPGGRALREFRIVGGTVQRKHVTMGGQDVVSTAPRELLCFK